MRITLAILFLSVMSFSETVPVASAIPLIPDQSVNSPDFMSLLASIFAINSSMQNYNTSIITPSHDVCQDWQTPEKMIVEEPKSKVESKTESQEKPVEVASSSAISFRSDGNPNKGSVLSQGCVQENLDILEKCFPPMADKLKRGEIKFDDLKAMPHEGFRIKSYSKDIAEARNWDFHHENRAKQDTGLTVMDGYHFGKGKVFATEMMFFPRKQIPQYQTKGNLLEVTLATGETVNFNTSSGIVQSGVLSENKPFKGKKPEISYQGSGVMIQMMGANGAGKSHIETATDAFIYKKGFQACKVPASDLWPQRKSGKSNNFRFATDEGLDEFLKKSKCGFSI